MRALVTGAAGFVGSHFVRHALQQRPDWEIVAPVSGRHRGDAANLALVFASPRFRAFHHDLRWPISDRQADDIGPVDAIVHCAAESHVERSISDPVPFIQNNVDTTLHALEFARRQPRLRAFVQISTDEVYGPPQSGERHAEWSVIRPSNPYAASKACQEAIAYAYWRTNDVPVLFTNTMNNFGEGQHGEKFVPYVTENILAGRRFGIHGRDGVFSSRCWTYVVNHADALLFLLDRELPRYPSSRDPERVNIVGDTELDSRRMVERIAAWLGREADWYPIDYHATRPGHDLRYALDGSRLAAMGWTPPHSFEDGLGRTLAWAAGNVRAEAGAR